MLIMMAVSIGVLGCNGPRVDDESFSDSSEEVEMAAENLSSVQTSLHKSHSPMAKAYVENSGSMYGYVGAGVGSGFKDMVFNYLTDVKLSSLFSGMELYFVNSQTVKVSDAVEDFVKKLEPNTFKISGGNAGSTDIVEVVKKVWPNDGCVSIMVSDCIISPGKGQDAGQYLVNQQTGLKGFLASRPNLENSGIIIYRFSGSFKGKYYDCMDNWQLYDGKRPYYVWVMGDVSTLKELRKVTEDKMKTKAEAICVVSGPDRGFRYSVVPAGGKYQLAHTDSHIIERVGKVKTQGGNRVVIKLNADFSGMLQDNGYLIDKTNYEMSDPMYSVDNIVMQQDSVHYVVTISCPVVKKGTVEVRLKNRAPQWANSLSTTDCTFPAPKDQVQKTYGLSYLIGGVIDAYTFNTDNLAVMKVTIQ